MKISFDDSSFLEMTVSGEGSIIVTLSARDGNNRNNTIVNSAVITKTQFNELVADVQNKLGK